MPLLSDHPDLVSDLKQCIVGAPPTSHQPGEVFEEVVWDGRTIPPPEVSPYPLLQWAELLVSPCPSPRNAVWSRPC